MSTVPPVLVFTSDSLRLIAYGDTGYDNEELRKTAGMVRKKYANNIHAAILLGDNFYPSGLTSERDPQFKRVFQNIIAKDTVYPYFAVLGNHDHLGDARAQLALHSIDARWNMPNYFYLQRFSAHRFDVCIWFLDTDCNRFTTEQANWLDRTLTSEKITCRWLIVTAHHPIFTVGEYNDNRHLKTNLLPILLKHGVHLYISGHEHQSQVMKARDGSGPTFLVAGANAEPRPPFSTRRDHPMYVWSEPKHLAFLVLEISHDKIEYSFRRSTGGRDADPIYLGEIS